MDIKKLGDEIVQVVREYVGQQLASVSKQLGELTVRLDQMPVAKDGKDGLDGKDADPEAIAAMVRDEVAALPRPLDGKSVTVEEVAPMIAEEVGKAVAALPTPKDGENGKDAEPVDLDALKATLLAEIPTPQDGKSVTLDDVEPMVSDLVAKAVAEIPKPKDGESIPVEQVQRMIDDAVSAAVTKAMSAVQMPKDGEPGRDALEIEVLSMIDVDRRYRRGTFASHKGGLWRAVKTTEGMDGWECIVDGVSAIEVSFHGRTGFVSVEKASGKPDLHPFALPAMIYRGVFKEGDEYAQGDTVTWGGSLWFCNEPTSDKPIDGAKSWQLAAKRGRDGRDGRDGIDKTKPVKL